MPFTPFHMGPGLFIKALLQGYFSLMIFGWTQILMDIQPLVVMLSGHGHVHGFTHTYIGATVVALLAGLTGNYAAPFGLRLMRQSRFLPIKWPVIMISAFVGAYSHVLLDSFMHSDLQPFAPFAEMNPFLRSLTFTELHLLCLGSGLVGLVPYFLVAYWIRVMHLSSGPLDKR